MTKADEREFAITLYKFAKGIGFTIVAEQISLYFNLLQDMSLEQVKSACITLARTMRYKTLPLPVEFRETIGDNERSNDLDGRALRALDLAIRMVTHHYWDSVIFEDKIIHLVIRALGGWVPGGFFGHDAQVWTWVKKDFIAYYKAFASAPIPPDCPQRLIGLNESELINWRRFDKIAPTILIKNNGIRYISKSTYALEYDLELQQLSLAEGDWLLTQEEIKNLINNEGGLLKCLIRG
ncbi:MAG: hypothetical protein HQK91_03900 [Nitrospirae bacterium]|nr:hypothetical protein [Nitrospirota bacterium]